DQVNDYAQPLWQVLDALPAATKGRLYGDLMVILSGMQKEGLVPVQRMCLNCQHLDRPNGSYYCNFLKRGLVAESLRVDCPEFVGN
ncbi:MAG: MarR family transcriptional regulator, partial [Bacteroidota bacterium]